MLVSRCISLLMLFITWYIFYLNLTKKFHFSARLSFYLNAFILVFSTLYVSSSLDIIRSSSFFYSLCFSRKLNFETTFSPCHHLLFVFIHPKLQFKETGRFPCLWQDNAKSSLKLTLAVRLIILFIYFISGSF